MVAYLSKAILSIMGSQIETKRNFPLQESSQVFIDVDLGQ
jgi:hypothetical protein